MGAILKKFAHFAIDQIKVKYISDIDNSLVSLGLIE
jgi:hypothetical protein